MRNCDREMLNMALEAAKKHGENSEPEHEVGDLQEIILKAVGIMSMKQRDELFASDEVSGLIDREGKWA